MDGEIIKALLSILYGVISGLAILPIASDAIRSRIFGRRKRAILDAKKELLDTVQEMLLSGQTINQNTFEILVATISHKYEILASTLGNKNDIFAQILQAINLSKLLPNKLKKQISGRLQEQLGDGSNNYDVSDVSIDGIDIDNVLVTEIIDEWHENDKKRMDNINLSSSERYFIFSIALAVGAFVAIIVYKLKSNTIFPIMLCIAAFLVCINMLISLMGTSEPKNIDFFRRLVYKIISIIVLIVFAIVLIIFLK